MFVDLLRVWFEEQERLSIAQQLLAPETPALQAGRATSLETAEYFVASLKGTPAEGPAYRQWVDFHTRRESLSRAALAFCELELNRSGPSLAAGEADLHYLRGWAVSHGETTLCQQIERQLAVPADATGDLPAWDAGEGADATAVPTADMLAAYTAVIELPGAPADQRAMAYFYRGITRAQQGDTAGALADYTAVIDLPDAPADQRAKAYFNRGITKGQQGDTAGELADYTAVIDLPDAPAEVRAKALGNLSEVCWRQDERSASLRHAQAALSVMGVEAGTRVEIFTGIAQAVCQGRSESDCRHDVAALCRMAVAGISRDDVETPVRILRGLAVPLLCKSWPMFLEQFCELLDGPARERLEMLRPAGDYLRRPDPVILQRLPPQERSFVEELVRSLCAEPEATPDPQSEPVPSPP